MVCLPLLENMNKQAPPRTTGYYLLAIYCALSSFILLLLDPKDVAFIVLGFALTLVLTLHPMVKVYLARMREQERKRKLALAEQARQEEIARQQAEEAEKQRQAQEARLQELVRQEQARKEAQARLADAELQNRNRE